MKICSGCLGRLARRQRLSSGGALLAAGLLGLIGLFIWAVLAGWPNDLPVGAQRGVAIIDDLEPGELSTLLGTIAAIAIGITIAMSDMASRVDRLERQTRSTVVVDMSVLQATITARLLLLLLVVLGSFAQAAALGLTIMLLVGESPGREVAVPVSILLTGYLLVQLSGALEMGRQLAWLDPRVRQGRGVDAVARIESRGSATRKDATVAWRMWWVFSIVPLSALGYAVTTWTGMLTMLGVSAVVAPLVRAGMRTFGRDVLVEVGAARTFTWVMSALVGLAFVLVEGALVLAALEESLDAPPPGPYLAFGAAILVTAARAGTLFSLLLGLDGRGPMRSIVWRELDYVRSTPGPVERPAPGLATPGQEGPGPSSPPVPASTGALWLWVGSALLCGPGALLLAGRGTEALVVAVLTALLIGLASVLAVSRSRKIGVEAAKSSFVRRRFLVPGCGVLSVVLTVPVVATVDDLGGIELAALLAFGVVPSAVLTMALCLGFAGSGPLAWGEKALSNRMSAADDWLVSVVSDSKGGASTQDAERFVPVVGVCLSGTDGCAGPSVSL